MRMGPQPPAPRRLNRCHPPCNDRAASMHAGHQASVGDGNNLQLRAFGLRAARGQSECRLECCVIMGQEMRKRADFEPHDRKFCVFAFDPTWPPQSSRLAS